MATKNYLDYTGLSYYDSKIKAYITSVLPSVSNATITIQKNGTAVDTFTLNGSAKTINITDVASATALTGLSQQITAINNKIPSEASSSNNLADKGWVNDQINAMAAYYITKNADGDAFATYAELSTLTTVYSGGSVRVPTRNDYAIVLADENHDNATTRYSYQFDGDTYNPDYWQYQYTVNESPFTQDQLDAINSGITENKVTTYDGYATSKQDALVSGTNIKTINNTSILGSGNITTPNTNYYAKTVGTTGLKIGTGYSGSTASATYDLYVPYATSGSSATAGVVKVGTGLNISSGTLNLGEHTSQTTFYGAATSSLYGHVKLGAANQNGATAADGVAAPNGHTHSQYLTSHSYRKINVNGTTVLTTSSSGAANFKNGTGINISATAGTGNNDVDITIGCTISDTNYYHTPQYSTGLKIGTGIGVSDLYVPYASGTQGGAVTIGDQTFAGEKTFDSVIVKNTTETAQTLQIQLFGDLLRAWTTSSAYIDLIFPTTGGTFATETYVADYTGSITNAQIDTLFA